MAKEEKKRPRKARTEWRVRRVIVLVLVALMACGVIYEIYVFNRNPIRVQPALEDTVVEKVSAAAFVFRDEQCIHADLSAYSVPFVQDGDRVSGNGAIAANFTDAGSARQFAQLLELRKEYDRLSALATGAEYTSVRVSTLMRGASDGLCAFLQQADTGDIAAASEAENNFLEKETALEIATGETIDFSTRLRELSAQIRAQEAAIGSYRTVTTGIASSGYFFSKTDGFEDVIAYADADKLTVAALESAMQTLPVSSTGGKLVKNFGWYIAAVVDFQTAEKLSRIQGKLRIAFPQIGLQEVSVTVYSMQTDASGKCAVVFRCIDNDSALLQLRKEEIEIILDKATGFRIPIRAVRIRDGKGDGTQEKGVYILQGNVVSFRKINPVYAGDDFILSAVAYDDDGRVLSGYIGQYEEIITEGKDLHEGAVVYR